MTAERVYSALLLLYPSSFRREYGSGLLEAFRQLYSDSTARRASAARFWLFIALDIGCSAIQLRVDACGAGARRFAVAWAGACVCGAVVTALLANALTAAFAYLYHPYLEGVTLPPWSYGALLGVGLAGTQAVLLRRRYRLGLLWIAATALGAALGLGAASAFARVAGPVGYGVVLGGVVGGSQWTVLRFHVRRAGWPVLASAATLSIGMLSIASTMHSTFEGLNPLSQDPQALHATTRGIYDATVNFLGRGLYGPATQTDVALEFAAMVTSGLVIAALTMRPLAVHYGHSKKP
jgi:hypothetical protein